MSTPKVTLATLEKRIVALEKEAEKNKGRIQTIITRLNQLVTAAGQNPVDKNAVLGQLRDLAIDLQRSL